MSNSSIINAEEPLANFMKTTARKREKIRETLEAFHSQSKSLSLLAFQWKDLEEYFDAVSDAIAKREEEIEVKNKEIEWKQKYLNKKSSDIEEKAKNVEKRLKMVDDRFEEVDEANEDVARLYREVKEKEKFCEKELEVARCKIERLRENKRDLKRKFEKKELKLEARELLIDNLLEELELRRTKLNSHERNLLERFGEVELREKRLEERGRDFEKREKMSKLKPEVKKVGNEVKVKKEPFDFDNNDDDDDDGDGALVDPSYADLKLNVTMDGIALQMFLNGRVNDHEILRDEIITGLGMSADPAKLVLDAMKGFYPDELGNECVGFDLNVIRKSCILLLEQLMKMKPRIKTHVKKRAMGIAMEWISKIKADDADNFLGAIGFLQLLATYGLSSGFTKDDLSSFFERCATYDGAPELCYNLGLTENVNDIIQNFITLQQPVEALRLIYAFGLVDVFPPIPILKAHLRFIFHRAEEVNNNGDHSLKLQIKCIRMKLSALVCTVRCIQQYGLEHRYPVQPLVQLISELEMQNKSLVSVFEWKSMSENEDYSIQHFPISSSAKETNTPIVAFGSSINESLSSYCEPVPLLMDSASAQTQGNSGNWQPRSDSVKIAKDISGHQQPVKPDWGVYGPMDKSWECSGKCTSFPYHCYL